MDDIVKELLRQLEIIRGSLEQFAKDHSALQNKHIELLKSQNDLVSENLILKSRCKDLTEERYNEPTSH